MYIVLTRSWNESWYNCFEKQEEAKQAYEHSCHWYPNSWLIEGKVIQEQTYSDTSRGSLPY